jgi:hypothetical protein
MTEDVLIAYKPFWVLSSCAVILVDLAGWGSGAFRLPGQRWGAGR